MKNFFNSTMKPASVLALASLLAVSCQSKKVQETHQQHPNVLFIAIDDLKPMLGCYGDSLIQTPNIDRLAQTGVVFTNAHCQQAVCGPSRASLLMGMRPDFSKIYDLKTFIRDKNPDITTLPQHFKNNGYSTAAVGKVFDVRSVDQHHDSLSWSEPYELLEGSNPIGEGWIYSKKRISTEAPDVADSITVDGKILMRGNELMQQLSRQSKPFFLAVGFHKPHLPFVAPKKYWDLYDRNDFKVHPFQEKPENAPGFAYQPGWEIRSLYEDVPKKGKIADGKQVELIHGYHACVSFIDQQVGLLLKQLDDLGLRENTIVVLWGDHGWHLGDHDMWCKHTNYEQSTRSPLIISYGSKFKGSNASPTEFVDIFPSLCDLSGVNTPAKLDGTSLLPIMSGEKEKVKDVAVSQFHRNGNLMGYAFRNERYRYVVWFKSKFKQEEIGPFGEDMIVAKELYDYKKDPLETRNLIDDSAYTSARKEMEQLSKDYFQKSVKLVQN
ncbi:sulfatase [Marinifilum breve]|nr:sulfatase [Marinifilum breve]